MEFFQFKKIVLDLLSTKMDYLEYIYSEKRISRTEFEAAYYSLRDIYDMIIDNYVEENLNEYE